MGWVARLACQEDTELADRAGSPAGTHHECAILGMAGTKVLLGRRGDRPGSTVTVCFGAGFRRWRLETHGGTRRLPGAAMGNRSAAGYYLDCRSYVGRGDHPATEGVGDAQES